jgi:hypothetical protein
VPKSNRAPAIEGVSVNQPPISRELLDRIVAEARRSTPEHLSRRYDALRVSPYWVPVRFNEIPENEHFFWVLGKSGKGLLLYDDLEEYFSVGVLDDDGKLRKWDNIEPQDRLDGAVAALDGEPE